MKGAFWLMVLGALGSAAIAVRLGHAADGATKVRPVATTAEKSAR
ncbi:hypothetical protein [Sphingobium subterraneum]|uniref:Uncharacterized protein n=1 Tax=Sphingobium subterraneum TaxID=627688 RepID=A0A841J4V8_9SPHN|nr:hypothetical protein [Sphingobium subterraneum]MBB6124556.1 hypothetical protein [Sphingobium subterraneum]